VECPNCGIEVWNEPGHPTLEACIAAINEERRWLWEIVLHPDVYPVAEKTGLIAKDPD
jgi:hypothetical protein